MKKEDFESLRRGMAEASAYRQGQREGFVVHEPLDVRQVRARTELKRRDFAERYRLDPRAVEQWEQGRRRPERGTEMYLRLIGQDPERVARMVSQALREEPTPYLPSGGGKSVKRKGVGEA
jgi:putative transcriptional regulator